MFFFLNLEVSVPCYLAFMLIIFTKDFSHFLRILKVFEKYQTFHLIYLNCNNLLVMMINFYEVIINIRERKILKLMHI